jgi:hypothetical protein
LKGVVDTDIVFMRSVLAGRRGGRAIRVLPGCRKLLQE